MKPSMSGLRRLNHVLKTDADKLLREILRSAVKQWTKVSGDEALERAICSWDVPRMLDIADVLVAAPHATADLHFSAHQLGALIRKYPWTPQESRIDPEAAALRSFVASERRCRRTNQWFRARRRRTGKTRPYEAIFEHARRWIRYVLGDAPDYRQVYAQCDLTAGASLGVHGDATGLARKLLATRWSVTPTALPFLKAALDANWHYSERFAEVHNGIRCIGPIEEGALRNGCEVVDYNKVGFVPKTAKTHRVIAVEPMGNTFLQKGVDLTMRGFLRRVGLDLRWQEPNQRMAREGSSDDEDSFCTIDLSSASDSIATEMVRELLPPDWFFFLNRIRSPSYVLPGNSNKTERYEKFVTMGNGFCFPLQTLLFSSLVKAISLTAKPGVDFRVYGDDIIVRKSIANDVISLLKVVGFQTNNRKTFLSGPFRESCGSNWYRGEDVTPMTLDGRLDSLDRLFTFLNQARRNERTTSFLSDVLPLVIRRIPDEFLFWRPFKGSPHTGIDPAGLEFTSHWARHSAWQCPMWWELHSRPVEDRLEEAPSTSWVVMAAALRGHPSVRPFTFRRRVEFRIRRVAAGCPEQGWPSRAPWLVFNGECLVSRDADQDKESFLNTRAPDLRDYRLRR